jgi:hypothetical protein
MTDPDPLASGTHPLDAMSQAADHHGLLLDSRTLARRPDPGAALWAPPIGPHYVRIVGASELRIPAIEVKS